MTQAKTHASPEGARILVVDDEPQIIRFLRPSLTAVGYFVEAAATGAEALRLAASNAPDVVLLDLGLPDMDGKLVIEKLRVWSKVPIIVLSARDRESEKIAALDLGADDYVNKPFAMGELLARLRVAFRNRPKAAGRGDLSPVIMIGELCIDTTQHSAALSGARLKLTPKEYDLLLMMMRNAGRVMTHNQLLTSVWGPAHTEDTQYLRVFVGKLRQKIESDLASPKRLLTEPGIGYRLASD